MSFYVAFMTQVKRFWTVGLVRVVTKLKWVYWIWWHLCSSTCYDWDPGCPPGPVDGWGCGMGCWFTGHSTHCTPSAPSILVPSWNERVASYRFRDTLPINCEGGALIHRFIHGRWGFCSADSPTSCSSARARVYVGLSGESFGIHSHTVVCRQKLWSAWQGFNCSIKPTLLCSPPSLPSNEPNFTSITNMVKKWNDGHLV